MMLFNFIFYCIALPNWAEVLKPQASLLLEYQEVSEKHRDSSSLLLGASLGIFPEWHEQWTSGIELKLAETDPTSIPDRFVLTEGPSNRPISLNQAYVAHRFSDRAFFSIGKFAMPFQSSPLTWDHDRTPEGLYTAWQAPLGSLMFIKFHAGQFFLGSGEQLLAAGQKNRRSWVFTEAVSWNYSSPQKMKIEMNLQIWNFIGIPEALALESLKRGADYQIRDGEFYLRKSRFMPIEYSFEISSLPLGILTALKTAIAMNVLSENQDFGLFGEVRLGRVWVKKNFLGSLSFYYNQPMTTLAYFTERDFGYSNRLAGRFELHYYVSESARILASYLLARRLEDRVYQDHRHEWRFGVEFKL
jgi:hypothetical protein